MAWNVIYFQSDWCDNMPIYALWLGPSFPREHVWSEDETVFSPVCATVRLHKPKLSARLALNVLKKLFYLKIWPILLSSSIKGLGATRSIFTRSIATRSTLMRSTCHEIEINSRDQFVTRSTQFLSWRTNKHETHAHNLKSCFDILWHVDNH